MATIAAADRTLGWWPLDGWIYFARSPESGLVKVGWTSRHPWVRITDPVFRFEGGMEPLGVLAGPVAREKRLQAAFEERGWWHHGEWFVPAEGLLAFIARRCFAWPGESSVYEPDQWLASHVPGEPYDLMQLAGLLRTYPYTLTFEVLEGKIPILRRGANGRAWFATEEAESYHRWGRRLGFRAL